MWHINNKMEEKQAFLEEIQLHKGIIIKVCNLYADDPEDRKDLKQEIIYQAFKSFKTFKGNAKFSTWLYKISLNVSLTYLNKRKKLPPSVELGVEEGYTEQHELSERSDRLYRAIRQLNEVDRGIVMLHLDGYNNIEISEISGISPNNTGVRLHRIKQQLTEILNK